MATTIDTEAVCDSARGKRKRAAPTASTTSQSKSRPEDVLEKALDSFAKFQDNAQIFGDFIASSIRELPTIEKQQELKRALNRALLAFQDSQSQQTQYRTRDEYTPQYTPNYPQFMRPESPFTLPL